MPVDRNKVFVPVMLFGALSIALYCLLYLFNAEILALSKQGR